jgi:hypothetical protein
MIHTMFLVGVGVIGLFALAMLAFARVGLRSRTAMQEAATALGLPWQEGGDSFDMGEIRGTFEGQDIHVFHHERGGGPVDRSVTVVRIGLHPAIPTSFHLGHENVLTKLGRLVLRHTDVEFGDAPFDDLFYVRSEHPDVIQRVFNAETRAALVAMAEGSDDLSVHPDHIRWESTREHPDAADIVRVVKAGCAAAASIRASLPRSLRGAPEVG